jgi:hypothetical protein
MAVYKHQNNHTHALQIFYLWEMQDIVKVLEAYETKKSN